MNYVDPLVSEYDRDEFKKFIDWMKNNLPSSNASNASNAFNTVSSTTVPNSRLMSSSTGGLIKSTIMLNINEQTKNPVISLNYSVGKEKSLTKIFRLEAYLNEKLGYKIDLTAFHIRDEEEIVKRTAYKFVPQVIEAYENLSQVIPSKIVDLRDFVCSLSYRTVSNIGSDSVSNLFDYDLVDHEFDPDEEDSDYDYVFSRTDIDYSVKSTVFNLTVMDFKDFLKYQHIFQEMLESLK